MTEMTPITLNLQAPNVNVVVHAKEGDRAGRFLNAKLVDGAREFIPPENAHFVVRYMKADGNGGLYDTMEDNETPAVTLSGNIATIGIAEQALTTQGLTQMELNIYDGNATRISAFKFNMIVEETVMPDGEVESTEYFNILTHEIALALQASGVVQAVVNMTVEAEALPAGSTPTVEKDYDPDEGTLKLTFGLVNGVDGKTAYQSAVDGGYTGTEAEFNVELAGLNEAASAAAASAAAAAQSKADVQALAETIAGNVGIDDDYTGAATTWSSNKIQEKLDEQSEQIDGFISDVALLIEGNQLFNKNNVSVGYISETNGIVYTGGAYDESSYTNYFIDVRKHEGEKISLTISGSLYAGMRTIAAYDINKELVSNKGSTNKSEYIIPEGVSYLKLTIYNNILNNSMISYDSTFPYEDYIEPYYIIDTSKFNEIDATKLYGMIHFASDPFSELIESKNKLDMSKLIYGKYVNPNNGTLMDNIGYATSELIKVEENETYTLQEYINSEGMIVSIPFMAGYNNNGNYVNGSGATSANEYTVPLGVKYVRICSSLFVDHPERKYSFIKSNVIEPYKEYFDDYYAIKTDFLQMKQIVEEVRESIVDTPKDIAIVGRLKNGYDGDSIKLDVPNCKKSNVIGFHANFTSFGSLQIGQGKTEFGQTGYVVIDNTHIKVYAYENGLVEKLNEEHNLNLTDYIEVIIEKPNDKLIYGKITVSTNGGKYTKDNVWMRMANEIAYAEILEGTFADIVLTYTATDFKCDVWAFGDSYFDHWVDIVLTEGYKNFYCDGYSGRNSGNAINSLEIALMHYTPKEVVWCMGMNDGDSENEVNANWKLNYDKLISICDENKIIPILCTIPNTPTVNNIYKNEIIRESGHRYIDLAAAVGSDISTSWFNGLLSNDNVHPSTEGDKMVAKFMESSIPEIK